MVKAIPEEYGSITPYLSVRNGADAIDFYRRAFGATERMRMPMPDGRIAHAELDFGGSVVMLADEMPEMAGEMAAPTPGSPVPVGIMLYVEDVDAVAAQAVAAGATISRPVADQFYGDRTATLIDPYGHVWTVGTHIKDVSDEEMAAAMEAMGKPA